MATQDEKRASDLGEQAIALAEQLGRIAGTIEGTAESWATREKLADQLTRVRDGASQMLNGLTAQAERGRNAAVAAVGKVRPMAAKGPGKKKTAKPAPAAAASQSDPSRAPGKRRRKPGPSMHGAKKSDERIPKMRTAAAVRQRRKSYA